MEFNRNPDFIKQVLQLPPDEVEKEDEEDERVEKILRQQREHVDRGNFYGI